MFSLLSFRFKIASYHSALTIPLFAWFWFATFRLLIEHSASEIPVRSREFILLSTIDRSLKECDSTNTFLRSRNFIFEIRMPVISERIKIVSFPVTGLNVSKPFKITGEFAKVSSSPSFQIIASWCPRAGPLYFRLVVHPKKPLKRKENFLSTGETFNRFMESWKFNIYNSLPIYLSFEPGEHETANSYDLLLTKP